MENIDLNSHIKISENGDIMLDKFIIRLIYDWWIIPGTHIAFFNFFRLKNHRDPNSIEKEQIRINTIKGKGAEFCEHLIQNVPIVLKNILRSDINGDGGIDLITVDGRKIDVKTRNSEKYGILIDKNKIDSDTIFSAYTVIFPDYKSKLDDSVEHFIYKHIGTISSPELRMLRSNGILIDKFNMHQVPSPQFKKHEFTPVVS